MAVAIDHTPMGRRHYGNEDDQNYDHGRLIEDIQTSSNIQRGQLELSMFVGKRIRFCQLGVDSCGYQFRSALTRQNFSFMTE